MDNSEISNVSRVLEFWFNGDINELYKNKWFPSGSGEMQHRADKLVYDNFREIFELAMAGELSNRWLNADFSNLTQQSRNFGLECYVSLIVILDQFSRHIFRFLEIASDDEIRKKADSMALHVTERLLLIDGWEKQLSTSQFIFSLMPLRHNANIERLKFILDNIAQHENRIMDSFDLLKKFTKQTTRRLQELQDKSRAKESEDILEKHPFVADESAIFIEPLVIAVESFLKRHFTDTSVNNVAISLSGGVDSMVIAKILGNLRKKLCIEKIVAIHIDYANREESSSEACYVEKWCQETDKQFNFHLRTVNEVTRGITDREEYEKVSREIRYSFYKDVLRETNCSAVILGHHMGDAQENVISNVMRGSSLLEIAGMSEIGLTANVPIWRPLINFSKTEIFQFAHKYGVPYFKDTTPTWSTRGKLRGKLIPLLTEMYGDGVLRNLTQLANQSDDYRHMLNQNLYEPFLKSVRTFKCGIAVNTSPYRDNSITFWKEMLKTLMHSMGMAMIRDKAVHNFMERLQRSKGKSETASGWLELRKGFHTKLLTNGDLIVFRDGVLHDDANEYRVAKYKSVTIEHNFSLTVTVETIGDNFTLRVGNWFIVVERLTTLQKPCDDPVIRSTVDLLCGEFEYHLQLSQNDKLIKLGDFYARGLKEREVLQFVKIPNSFSKFDLRLRLGLPLLVPIVSESEEKCVRETYKLRYLYSV